VEVDLCTCSVLALVQAERNCVQAGVPLWYDDDGEIVEYSTSA